MQDVGEIFASENAVTHTQVALNAHFRKEKAKSCEEKFNTPLITE